MLTKVPAHCSADVCVRRRERKGLLRHCFLTQVSLASSLVLIGETRPRIHEHVSLVFQIIKDRNKEKRNEKKNKDRSSWSWTRRSGSIYHLWSMLLSKARAGQRAKEYLLENLKDLTEWKIQQGDPACVWVVFSIHNRPLLYCWVSEVKSLNRWSSNNSSYLSLLKRHDLAEPASFFLVWTAPCSGTNIFWGLKTWPQWKMWESVNTELHNRPAVGYMNDHCSQTS